MGRGIQRWPFRGAGSSLLRFWGQRTLESSSGPLLRKTEILFCFLGGLFFGWFVFEGRDVFFMGFMNNVWDRILFGFTDNYDSFLFRVVEAEF